MTLASHLTKGQTGEVLAQKYLRQNGYKIIETNFKSRYGEIDIIAERKNRLYFIEVKTRKSDRFGGPLGAVSTSKQRKLYQSTEVYLSMTKGFEKHEKEFAVIAVVMGDDEKEARVELIKNAFDAF